MYSCVALEVRQGGTSRCCITHCVGTSSDSLLQVGSDLAVNSNALMTSLSLTQVVSHHTHFVSRKFTDWLSFSLPTKPAAELLSYSTTGELWPPWHHANLSSGDSHLCPQIKELFEDTKHADFARAHMLLNLVNLDQVLTANINESWNIWQKMFMKVMEHCIPRGTLPKRHNLPLTRTSSRLLKNEIAYTGNRNVSNDPRLTLKYTRLQN